MGKLIVIEGLDGSGKGTQTDRLAQVLSQRTGRFMRIDLPNYGSDACKPVEMYLGGAFGDSPYAVNPYAACAFFAVDRYAHFKQCWEKEYNAGWTVLANRFTTANIVHHIVKLPRSEWEGFARWVYDFEFKKMGIPAPDKVIYLDMDPAIAQRLLSERYDGDETKKDIHEKDAGYLAQCREGALYVAGLLNWQVVRCFGAGRPLAIDDITQAILSLL